MVIFKLPISGQKHLTNTGDCSGNLEKHIFSQKTKVTPIRKLHPLPNSRIPHKNTLNT
jgi:hypothetical protein